jgi:hypothetical protein
MSSRAQAGAAMVWVAILCAVVLAAVAGFVLMPGQSNAPTVSSSEQSQQQPATNATATNAPLPASPTTPAPTTMAAPVAATLAAPATAPAASDSPAPAAVVQSKPPSDDRTVPLDFRALGGFRVSPLPVHNREPLPERVTALNGRRVSLFGYVIPGVMDGLNVTEFLLVDKLPDCQFCAPPQINEFVVVKMPANRPLAYEQNKPVLVTGRLTVGPEIEDGLVSCLYQMKAESVTDMAMEPAPGKNSGF